MDVSTDIIIGAPNGEFEAANENCNEIVKLLSEKRLPELEIMYEELKGEAFRDGATTYEDLTDEQKAAMDEILDNIVFYRSDVVQDYSQRRSGASFLCFPAIVTSDCEDSVADWLTEKNAYGIEVHFDNLTNDDGSSMISSFLYAYHRAIDYVVENY